MALVTVACAREVAAIKAISGAADWGHAADRLSGAWVPSPPLGHSTIWGSSGERRARPTQYLINRCCGWIDQTVGTVAAPANCVTCAPFINHTATLPFAQ
jgi:hypothetical protein